jgi:copper chaperone CopZ
MKYTFKTNINCLGCVNQVKPHLDQLEQTQAIEHWRLDLNSPEHILTIETNALSREEVENVIETAGFSTQPVQ